MRDALRIARELGRRHPTQTMLDHTDALPGPSWSSRTPTERIALIEAFNLGKGDVREVHRDPAPAT